MALLFVDGCDSYSASSGADLAERWDSVDTAQLTFLPTGGRWGGGAINFTNDVLNLHKKIPRRATYPGFDDLYISFSAFIATTYDTVDEPLFSVGVEGGGTSNAQLTFNTTSTGTIEVSRGSISGTVLGTTANPIPLDTWTRIEVRISARNAIGEVEIRFDEVGQLTVTATDTQNETDASGINYVSFGSQDAGTGIIMDDIVIHDSFGSSFNSFLGDIRIHTIRPDAAGDQNDSTPLSGTRFSNVDDAGTNDGDTTYVSLASSADYDLYNVGSIVGTPATIHAVAVAAMLRSDDVDEPRQTRLKIKSGTVEDTGAIYDVPFGASYQYVQDAFYGNPDGALTSQTVVKTNLIRNPSFDDDGGSTSEWLIFSGTWRILTTSGSIGAAQDGTYFLEGSSTASGEILQTVDVRNFDDFPLSEIDAGNVTCSFSIARANSFNQDTGSVIVQCLDEFFNDVGTALLDTGFEEITPTGTWVTRSFTNSALPSGTRFIKVSLFHNRVSGTFSNAAFDDITMSIRRTNAVVPGAWTASDMTGLQIGVEADF